MPGISDREMGELHLEHVKFSACCNDSDDNDDDNCDGGGGGGNCDKKGESAHNKFSFPNSNVLVFFQESLAMQTCTAPGVLEMFQNNNALLEQIMKCLEAYLESKRVIFPRFYFLSNAELLGILAKVMCVS